MENVKTIQEMTAELDAMEASLKERDVRLKELEARGDGGDPERKKKMESARKQQDALFHGVEVSRMRLAKFAKALADVRERMGIILKEHAEG